MTRNNVLVDTSFCFFLKQKLKFSIQTLKHDPKSRETFYYLLAVLPGLIITSMLYPFPEETSSFATGMTVFNSLDMAELMFGDAGCIQNESIAWRITFYFALGVAAILTCFHWGLEGLGSKEDEPKRKDYASSIISLLFNDSLFLVLRCKVMDFESAYLNLLFPMKELFTIFCKIGLIIYYFCRKEQ